MIMDGMGTKKGSLFHRVSLYLIVVSPPTAISYTLGSTTHTQLYPHLSPHLF